MRLGPLLVGSAFGSAFLASCNHTRTAVGGANPRLGAWRAANGQEAIAFEEDRVVWFRGGELRFYRARDGNEEVLLETWGRKERLGVALDGARLSLRTANGERSFVRAEEIPESLVLPTFRLDGAGPVPEEEVEAIRTELARREKEDQAVRTDPARANEMPGVDQANTEYLKRTVERVGWIDAGRFGRGTARAAFLIVQHSGDLPLMTAVLPEIEKDMKAKRVDPQDFALLHDRLQISTGRRQRYGSQIGQDDEGRPVVLPLEDRSKVEALREELGLMPLARYLERIREMTGGGEVRFLDDRE